MMDVGTLRLRTRSWHGDIEQSFPLPEGWTVDVLPPRDAPELSPDATVAAIREPIGIPPIAQAASGRKDAILLVDDLARPTPAELICMAVMDELNRAGIADDKITILIATGGHRPLTRREMALKLGQAMARAGRTITHYAFDPEVDFLGLTDTALPVLVNRVASQAEFSVGISSICAHTGPGFGGGGKLVLPGISHIASIHWLHSQLRGVDRGSASRRSEFRRTIDEAAGIFGLNAIAAAVVNSRREICGLFVGHPEQAHRRGVTYARRVHGTDFDPGSRYDLVIANAYPYDAEPTQISKSTWPSDALGVPVVVIADFYRPVQYHAFYDGPYARFVRQRPKQVKPQTVQDLMEAGHFLYAPSYGKKFIPQRKEWYCENNWPRLMSGLERRFPRAKVLVLPTAPLQILEPYQRREA